MLAGTLALLVIFGIKRAALERTTLASLRWFWIYLGALAGGVVLIVFAAPLADASSPAIPPRSCPASRAPFSCSAWSRARASSRSPRAAGLECFVLGACSVAYTFFLFYAGRQPALMTSCMFGGALISLMLLLFVGVIRYARSHP